MKSRLGCDKSRNLAAADTDGSVPLLEACWPVPGLPSLAEALRCNRKASVQKVFGTLQPILTSNIGKQALQHAPVMPCCSAQILYSLLQLSSPVICQGLTGRSSSSSAIHAPSYSSVLLLPWGIKKILASACCRFQICVALPFVRTSPAAPWEAIRDAGMSQCRAETSLVDQPFCSA